MPRMNRRRTLIGIATLVFGASGFVASGAFTTGSQGSLGDNWIQVAGTDQAVSFESPQQVDVGDGSDGDGGGDGGSDEETTDDSEGESDDGSDEEQPNDGSVDDSEETDEQDEDSQDDGGGSDDGGGDDDDDESETGTTRVQVVTAPDNPGNAVNGGGSATWDGTIVASSAVRGTDDGFFGGVTAEDVNRNATSTIGYLQDGYPNGRAAFIIANVGPEEEGGRTGSVGVTATLFADGAVLETDQLRFPYRVVDSDGTAVARGENLFTAREGDVTLADGHVIEVVIVVDTTDGDDELRELDRLNFTAAGVGR